MPRQRVDVRGCQRLPLQRLAEQRSLIKAPHAHSGLGI